MTEVRLHVYDVTNSGSDKTNNTIVNINKIFKDAIGLGGIFHSAVQIYGEDEWSFGFCEQGTGVFSCPYGKNPMYTYRECINLGKTNFSISMVNHILRELSKEWPGTSYDLLSKNCNHFCDELCARLGVPKLPDPRVTIFLVSNLHANPYELVMRRYLRNSDWHADNYVLHILITSPAGWVNRFANAGDTALEVAGNTAVRFRQAKTEIVTASKVAYRFLAGVATNNNPGTTDSPGNSNNRGGLPKFQGAWFKNLITNGAKPSSSSEFEKDNENAHQLHRQQDAAAPENGYK